MAPLARKAPDPCSRLPADFQRRVLLYTKALPLSLKKKALPWSSATPQIMTLFYLESRVAPSWYFPRKVKW